MPKGEHFDDYKSSFSFIHYQFEIIEIGKKYVIFFNENGIFNKSALKSV